MQEIKCLACSLALFWGSERVLKQGVKPIERNFLSLQALAKLAAYARIVLLRIPRVAWIISRKHNSVKINSSACRTMPDPSWRGRQ